MKQKYSLFNYMQIFDESKNLQVAETNGHFYNIEYCVP